VLLVPVCIAALFCAGIVFVALPKGPGQVIVGVALLVFSWAGSDHLSHGPRQPERESESRPFVMHLER
jgi:hypothetical protein